MNMIRKIKADILEFLRREDFSAVPIFSFPPDENMGELALGCFPLAKEKGIAPAVLAEDLSQKFNAVGFDWLKTTNFSGPYVNFVLEEKKLAEAILTEKENRKDKKNGQKILLEFGQPNTHKALHIGHLRNLITGESLARIFEHQGFVVTRANYQGDIGPHVAKCLWGIRKSGEDVAEISKSGISEKVAFLAKAYVAGSKAFEEDAAAKEEILAINKSVYEKSAEIFPLYQETRKWSLEYFENFYDRLGIKFDRLYFESEIAERGREVVLDGLEKGVFEKSEGAVIFPGAKYGLHDRVFLNQKGLPTYEAKDVALAELQNKEFEPNRVIHVVGKEQTEYFRVLFKALGVLWPELAEKEQHLAYGWVSLKGGKMSSRLGQVVLAEQLLQEVETQVKTAMTKTVTDEDDARQKISLSAVKYAFLHAGVGKDIQFDLGESVDVHGDSGPYLLYIVARINSLFKKGEKYKGDLKITEQISAPEKKLFWKIALFEEAVSKAASETDPSAVAGYLFSLAQCFNGFYAECPILQAPDEQKQFRMALAEKTRQIMKEGLYLLGIESVEEM